MKAPSAVSKFLWSDLASVITRVSQIFTYLHSLVTYYVKGFTIYCFTLFIKVHTVSTEYDPLTCTIMCRLTLVYIWLPYKETGMLFSELLNAARQPKCHNKGLHIGYLLRN